MLFGIWGCPTLEQQLAAIALAEKLSRTERPAETRRTEPPPAPAVVQQSTGVHNGVIVHELKTAYATTDVAMRKLPPRASGAYGTHAQVVWNIVTDHYECLGCRKAFSLLRELKEQPCRA